MPTVLVSLYRQHAEVDATSRQLTLLHVASAHILQMLCSLRCMNNCDTFTVHTHVCWFG